MTTYRDGALPIKAQLKEMLWRRLYREFLPDETVDTVSFDVFDTLITRSWFRPMDQFAAAAPRLRQLGLCALSDLQWMQLRHDCEVAARQRATAEEVSLRDIYAVISERLDWTAEQLAQAYAIELQRELNDIRPIAHAYERMRHVRRAGKKVIAVSDTYFSNSELSLLLQRCGYNLESDDIYASSDYRLTKGSGRLFSAILERRKLLAGQLCHIGDQPVGDGRAPANLGIRSTISADYAPTRYEKIFASANLDNLLICSAVAGSARTSRLARTFAESHSLTIWNIGTNIIGPLLFAFTLWVLMQAKDRRIERLYFLARDGKILFEVAQILCRWCDWPIDCRYLHSSRQSFSLPSLSEPNERQILMDYLSQEGLMDGAKWALCDVGWGGSIQQYIEKITAKIPEFPKDFESFYFGLYPRRIAKVERAQSFYPGDVSRIVWLVEAFCATDEGSVSHFARDAAGRAVPVQREASDTGPQIEWGICTQRMAVLQFVNDLTKTLNSRAISVDTLAQAISQKSLAVFDLFRRRPSLEEADTYGSFVFMADPADKLIVTAGPILRPGRLLNGLALRHRSGLQRIWWPEGSIRRSTSVKVLQLIFRGVDGCRVLWERFRGNPSG